MNKIDDPEHDVTLRAIAAARHIMETGEKVSDVSEKRGIARKRIERVKRILTKGIPEVLEAVTNNQISVTKGEEIARIGDVGVQKEILEKELQGAAKMGDITVAQSQNRPEVVDYKILNEERVEKILEFVDKLDACCKSNFPSPFHIIGITKQLREYCLALKSSGTLMKQRGRKKNR